MSPHIRSVAVLLAASVLAACAGIPQEERLGIIDRQGIDIVGRPSHQIAVVIKDPKSVERYCSGPGPDFSLTASEGVELSLGARTPAVGESASRGALDLGGRNPAVLLAREMFYRTCELTMNINASTETALALHKMTMEAVERIAATQTGAGVTPLAAAAPPVSVNLPAPAQTDSTSSSSSDESSTDTQSPGFSGGSPDS